MKMCNLFKVNKKLMLIMYMELACIIANRKVILELTLMKVNTKLTHAIRFDNVKLNKNNNFKVDKLM